MDNSLMTVEEVSEYLKVKRWTIYTWAEHGEIPAIKMATRWRFRRSDIDQWLEQHANRYQRSSQVSLHTRKEQ